MLNVEKIRADFPFFLQKKNGQSWAFLDNAASTQKLEAVLHVMDNLYRTHFANIHRGVYDIAEAATQDFEETRNLVAKFINASQPEEIIFTKNTTEALNALAYTLGFNLKAGDEVVLSEMEHHANLVPWQQACQRTGAILKFIPVTPEFRLNLNNLDKIISSKTKVVSVVVTSNVLGTTNKVELIIAQARKVGALVILDGAQSVPHQPTDVQKLDCDFLAFSAHKIYGPTGVGVLYGKRKLLENLSPFLTGGHMIDTVEYQNTTWGPIPAKFEAGTPAIAEVVGFGEVIKYFNKIGWQNILAHEFDLTNYSLKKLQAIKGLKLFGPRDSQHRCPVFTFSIEGLHAHDLASILNDEGVAVRAGHHCTQPLHRKFGLIATTRASCTIYNTKDDINRLVDGIKKAQKILG